MAVLLRIGAVRFYFYSNEGRPLELPHVHVRSGYDEAKFGSRPLLPNAITTAWMAAPTAWR